MTSEETIECGDTDEDFEAIMNRRLAKFTMSCLQQEIRVKLKGNFKIYTGTLNCFDPVSLAIIVNNCSGMDERTELKILRFEEIDYYFVTKNKLGSQS